MPDSRRHTLFAVCVFCLLFPVGAGAQGGISRRVLLEQTEKETVEQSVMRFEKADAVFPTLEETDAPYTLEYPFVNRGREAITIRKVTVSCGCMAADYAAAPIPPGGRGSVKITFNPKGYSGDIYRQAFVYTSLSDELPTARLTLTGKVAPSKDPWRSYPYRLGALRARQKSVTFKVNARVRKLAEVIACGNSGNTPLTLVAKGLPGYMEFYSEHPVISPGETTDLIFVYDAAKLPEGMPKGRQSVPVTIEGVGEAGTASDSVITINIQFD